MHEWSVAYTGECRANLLENVLTRAGPRSSALCTGTIP